jgi:hypothetical protein
VYKRILYLAAAALLAPAGHAYSVLTHEAIIDTAWDGNIKPLLVKRFPAATPDELLHAHAFAYGGCIVQDMGYYPFGSKFFSDLTHYVRTGDFVVNLIKNSQDLDEYAFALGALAHYAADNEGHPLATNAAVPIEYPKLRRRFGKEVTYEDDPTAHIRVEFGFDVLQVARGNYAPKSYHDFIGFEVAKPVLERAFYDTYSLELKDVFKSLDLALGTYRRSVSAVIPEMTKTAWSMKKDDLMKARPALTRRQFIYNLSRASYEKEWDGGYERPGIGARILGFFLRIVPKVGPFKAIAFKPPTPQTAADFEASFNKTLDLYRTLLAEARAGRLQLANRNFDTGEPTEPARYGMADDAFAKLAVKLADRDAVGAGIRDAIIAYYRNPGLPFATKKDPKNWQATLAALDKLKSPLAAGK